MTEEEGGAEVGEGGEDKERPGQVQGEGGGLNSGEG